MTNLCEKILPADLWELVSREKMLYFCFSDNKLNIFVFWTISSVNTIVLFVDRVNHWSIISENNEEINQWWQLQPSLIMFLLFVS